MANLLFSGKFEEFSKRKMEPENNTLEVNNYADPFFYEQITATLFVIPGIFADVLIISSLWRFKKMQTKTNLYILSWSLADLVYCLSIPFYHFDETFSTSSKFSKLYCVFSELFPVALLVNYIVILMVQVDFVHDKLSERNTKISLVILWVVGVLMAIIFLVLCFNGIGLHIFPIIPLDIVYSVLFLTQLVKFFYFSKRKIPGKEHPIKRFRFILVSAYLINWFPFYLYYFFLFAPNHFYVIVETIVLILGELNSFFNLFLFAYLDKNFKICFMQMLKSSSVHEDDVISYEDMEPKEEEENLVKVDL